MNCGDARLAGIVSGFVRWPISSPTVYVISAQEHGTTKCDVLHSGRMKGGVPPGSVGTEWD